MTGRARSPRPALLPPDAQPVPVSAAPRAGAGHRADIIGRVDKS
jgi:hypothetical protein